MGYTVRRSSLAGVQLGTPKMRLERQFIQLLLMYIMVPLVLKLGG